MLLVACITDSTQIANPTDSLNLELEQSLLGHDVIPASEVNGTNIHMELNWGHKVSSNEKNK